MKTLLRIIVIGAILLILVFLSIGIVKIVPKALSSLASATVSIGSLFGNGNATSTNSVNTTGNSNGETILPNGNGFIVVSSSTQTGSPWTNSGTNTNATTSLLDLITPKFGTYPSNNYVPTPAGQPTNKEILEAEKKALAEKSGTNNTNTTGANGAYTNTSNTQYASRACVVGAQPDLAVSILSRGIISKTTGQYIETNNFTTSDTVSIKFKIENRGLCSTGTWNFKAEMPSVNAVDQIRTVANVASIPAGSAVSGQANFDSPRAGSSNVIFTVTDTSGRDSNTSNNTAVSALVVTNNGTGNNGGVPLIGDGRADLSVRILQTGILSYNNQFIPTNTVNGATGTYGGNFRSGDRVAVQFEITNQGQSATGAWNFKADLTGNGPIKTYNNPQYEASIPAGGRAVYTIAFDNMQIGSNTITIFLDSQNQVNEFNEGNNIGSVGFNVSY